ncbi:hypothetical protein EG827_04945 [bacterium]|nr:hypothetical protein [bacterium]
MKLSSIVKNFFLRVINTEAFRRVSLVAAAFILFSAVLTAQDGSLQPSKTQAQAAWDKGNYELAYEHYNGLLLLYSRDPLYKYYTGACLVKMERDIPRAVTLLGSAITSSVNIKSVPSDVWFYYGRALQMNGSFAQASEAYGSFSREAGRKVSADYEVESYIDQCSRGKGALSPEPSAGSSAVSSTTAATTKAPSNTASKVTAATTATATSAVPNTVTSPSTATSDITPPTASPSNPTPSTTVAVKPEQQKVVQKSQATSAGKLPGDYYTILAEAVKIQHEADSTFYTAGDTARAGILQAEADSLFLMLEKAENPVPETAAVQPEQIPPAHLFSDFEVRPAPAYSEKNPVPIDQAMPSGLVYTLQIAAFRNPVAPSLFRGLYPVYGRKRPDSDATYYYTGFFRRIDDARVALPQARGAGFTDAFVIALMDGTKVSMERAQLLEKEWTAKPLPGREASPAGEKGTTTVNPEPVETLSFRAEVMRITKPVKPEVIEKVEMLAGTRGLDMIKNSSGETVFLIGNFITFESADEYVSLLIRNGYNTARVAAYVGMQEIPVEAAKELLNRLHDD